jgi:hypothetical protein
MFFFLLQRVHNFCSLVVSMLYLENRFSTSPFLFRSCDGPEGSDRGCPVSRSLPGFHPAGVRGPAHQGHEDDAGRGGCLQDQGQDKETAHYGTTKAKI